MAYSAPLYMEVRWRLHGSDEAWSEPRRVKPVGEVVVEELDRTKQYDFEARNVSACGAKSDWVPSTHTVPDVPAGNLTLSDIKTEVDNAAADAMAAIAELANIASDNVLSEGEKPLVIRDTNVITTEQAGIDAQATAYGITTEKTAYDGAVTALTTYLATLTTPTLWSDLGGDTTIVGTTFRSKFANVYTKRQALLNAIYAAAKAKADAAQASADAVANSQPIINPNFGRGDLTGWTSDYGTWSYQSGTAGPETGTSTYAIRTGSSGTPTDTLRNLGKVKVYPGAVIKAACSIRANGANGTCSCLISWRDASGAEILVSQGNTVTGTTLAASFVTATAPAGAYMAHIEAAAISHTTGTYTVDGFIAPILPDNLDQVPDGGTYAKVAGTELVNGTVPPPNLGDNICQNPGFELNAAGVALDTGRTSGDLCDGWVVGENSTGAGTCVITTDGNSARTHGGTRRLKLGLPSGVSIPNGTNIVVGAWTNKKLPVTAGDVYYVYAYAFNDRSVTPPSGISATTRVQMRYFDANDNFLTQSGITYSSVGGTMTTPLVASSTVPSGASYARIYCFLVFSNSSGSAQTSDNGWLVANIDDIVVNKQHALETSGSGRRLGDLRNQIMVGVGNYGAGWSGGAITYSASSTSATINAAAATLQVDQTTISYNASSTTVSGSAGVTRTYYLYYDDDGYTGGSKTLNATTNQITSLSARGRLLVGQVSVTFPTSGTGSGGGSSGCPDENAWVLRADPEGLRPCWPVRAKHVEVGQYLALTDGRAGLVTYSQRKASPRVRVATEHGRSLTCSPSAPLELAEGISGDCLTAQLCRNAFIRVLYPVPQLADRIVSVEDAGDGYVQHITCENACFWTGDDPDHLFAHHNLKPPL